MSNDSNPDLDDEPLFNMETQDDLTVMKGIPEELMASARKAAAEADEGRTNPPPPMPAGSSAKPSGLKQMFARDAEPARNAMPNETEGDALLDMLFDDAHAGTKDIARAPAQAMSPGPLPAKSAAQTPPVSQAQAQTPPIAPRPAGLSALPSTKSAPLPEVPPATKSGTGTAAPRKAPPLPPRAAPTLPRPAPSAPRPTAAAPQAPPVQPLPKLNLQDDVPPSSQEAPTRVHDSSMVPPPAEPRSAAPEAPAGSTLRPPPTAPRPQGMRPSPQAPKPAPASETPPPDPALAAQAAAAITPQVPGIAVEPSGIALPAPPRVPSPATTLLGFTAPVPSTATTLLGFSAPQIQSTATTLTGLAVPQMPSETTLLGLAAPRPPAASPLGASASKAGSAAFHAAPQPVATAPEASPSPPPEPFEPFPPLDPMDATVIDDATARVRESIPENEPRKPDSFASELSRSSRPSMPSRPSLAPVFPEERDAAAHLLGAQQRDAWVERAAWLREEAEAVEDRSLRARALLTVSELYAMSGEEPTAKLVATSARELAPSSPLAHRQARGLAMRDADWQGVLEAVDSETRVMPTPASRCHGSLVGAEIARLVLGDTEGTKKRVEHATRAYPTDPRPYAHRLATELATREDATELAKNRVPDAPELAPLAEAWAQVLAHRGVGPQDREPGSRYEELLRARAAVRSGDWEGVVAALEGLRRVDVLAGGAGWLGAVFAATRKETRPRAVDALRRVVGGSHASQARRAMAARAIELGDATAARAATEAADSEAFSASDRIALAALTGSALADVEPWIEATVHDQELAPIAAATTAALSAVDAPDRRLTYVGAAKGRAGAALGRSLASSGATIAGTPSPLAEEALTRAVEAFARTEDSGGVAKALLLELDVEAHAGVKVAATIATWRRGEEGSRDASLASALIAEVAGERAAADEAYERARQADPSSEAAVRARAGYAEAAAMAQMVVELAHASEGAARSPVLLVEAAVRLAETGDNDAAAKLLRQSADIDPTLPLAIQLGERAARERGDQDGLIEWLRLRRGEASSDSIEQAHDLVREALLASEADGAGATSLLEQALRARPGDAGLRELYERLSPERPADSAAWRADRSMETQGVEAARLALEAALEYERMGDLERASICAKRAVSCGDRELAPLAVYRTALGGHGAGDLIDAFLSRARESSDLHERLEIYEQLAELDELGRGDPSSGLLWRRSIMEEAPTHMPTLRRVASTLIAGGRDEEFEPVALEIARATTGPESVAHATVAARLRVHTSGWDDTFEPVQIAYKSEPRSIWALRQMAAHARAKGLHALALETDKQLADHTNRPSETATILLRAAQAAVRAEDLASAKDLLGRALQAAPMYMVLHLELASVLEHSGEFAAAANSLEEAAETSELTDERKLSFYRAAVLWLDKANEPARGRAALEAVATLDPAYEDVFRRLQTIYVAEGERGKLADLLARRLDNITDPNERVEMEVLRGRALADVGDAAEAKRALAAALDASPDHVEALSAFADLCAADADWSGAEHAWIRLVRLLPDPARQTAIYFRLAGLYDEQVPNPERAELAYGEILKRAPSDETARERLVALYKRSGDVPRALEQQTILINSAEAPEAKCRRTVGLAEIFEITGDAKKAEATLLQARKTWPKDDVALAALARYYQRCGQNPAAQVLLDRAVGDARRALGTGRFEPYLFESIATVAALRGRTDASRVARATVAALEGGQAEVAGAGEQAGSPALDELLAPEVMTPAFRELLAKTGAILDQAVPIDLNAIRATPLPPLLAHIGGEVQALALAYGLPGIQVQVSNVLGATSIPAASFPPTLILGQALVASPRADVRTFLIHRALKAIQTNTGAFSRTAPIDLWPLLAAFLKAFSPNFTPQGVDTAKFTDFYARVRRTAPGRIDPQLGLLAADVIGSIGNRASTLNTAINGWGARAGLLAVGDPNVALTGVAWAGGHTNQPPAAGKERLTWIGRNAEARELVLFSVSDAYADARHTVGLAR